MRHHSQILKPLLHYPLPWEQLNFFTEMRTPGIFMWVPDLFHFTQLLLGSSQLLQTEDVLSFWMILIKLRVVIAYFEFLSAETHNFHCPFPLPLPPSSLCHVLGEWVPWRYRIITSLGLLLSSLSSDYMSFNLEINSFTWEIIVDSILLNIFSD